MPTREEVLAQLNGEVSAAPAGPSREQVLAELNGESPPAAAAPDGPGMGTSALMGAGGSASFGFNDEAGGFLGALAEKVGLTSQPEIVRAQTREGAPIANAAADAQDAQTFGDRYRANRDEIRGVDQASREAHPWAYHGAGIAAAVANPTLAAEKGAGFLGRMASATDQGLLAGAGNSEADLTEGDVGGFLRDSAVGAGTGAAAGLLGEGAGAAMRAGGRVANRVVTGAGERQAIRNVDALLEKTPAVRTQDRANAVLGGKEGISKVLKGEGLEKYARKAKEGLELAQEKLDDVGGDIGSIYAKADEAMPQGAAMRSEVYGRLDHLLQGYAEKDQVEKFSALKAMTDRLKALDSHLANGAEPVDRPMSATQLFELKKQLNKIGWSGPMEIASQDARQAGRDAGEIMRDFLAERVDKATGQAERLGRLNEKWRDLNEITAVFAAKAKRDERMAPSLGGRFAQYVGAPLAATGAALAGATALSHGNLPMAAAGLAPAIAYGAPMAARGMDGLLIMLGDAAKRTGAVPADLIRRAVNMGIPEETAAAVVRGSQPQPGAGFDQWYAGMAAQKGLDPNPDAPEHHYDYRSYYRDAGGTPDGHFPSQYKTAGHPREYLTDSNGRIFDTKTGTYVEDGSSVTPDELDRAEYAPELRQRIVR
jgi:hypothetical protein